MSIARAPALARSTADTLPTAPLAFAVGSGMFMFGYVLDVTIFVDHEDPSSHVMKIHHLVILRDDLHDGSVFTLHPSLRDDSGLHEDVARVFAVLYDRHLLCSQGLVMETWGKAERGMQLTLNPCSRMMLLLEYEVQIDINPTPKYGFRITLKQRN